MRNISFIFSVLLVILFTSCRGNKQETLIGKWEQIPHYEPGDTRVFWQFYVGDALSLYVVDELTVATGL